MCHRWLQGRGFWLLSITLKVTECRYGVALRLNSCIKQNAIWVLRIPRAYYFVLGMISAVFTRSTRARRNSTRFYTYRPAQNFGRRLELSVTVWVTDSLWTIRWLMLHSRRCMSIPGQTRHGWMFPISESEHWSMIDSMQSLVVIGLRSGMMLLTCWVWKIS